MVDSNLQREQITPSEKAYAYKMKYDAIKKKEQQEIIDAMEATQCTPSLSQAIRIKKLSEAGKLTESETEAALMGMLSKHLISVSDMCTDDRVYPKEQWDEKITDSINYLLILRALVEEEMNEED